MQKLPDFFFAQPFCIFFAWLITGDGGDDIRDTLTKLFGDLLVCGACVFNGVVEDRGAQDIFIQLSADNAEVGGDFEAVGDVRERGIPIAGLVLVFFCREEAARG
ncbi:MAG: hypothetical protein R2688_02165 [Fimbriimonadaceae bacterium]